MSPKDLLEVRACGTTLVETFRRRAMTGDDAWMKELEVESIGGAKGALGAQRSGAALRKVILDERDWILARRLWEAGEEAGGAPGRSQKISTPTTIGCPPPGVFLIFIFVKK